MAEPDRLTPIFYVRGLNPPYTEGHIAIVQNMLRALQMQGMTSFVFNYRYNTGYSSSSADPETVENLNVVKFEQNVPPVNREDMQDPRARAKIFYASLIESLATLRFLVAERRICRNGKPIVNVVNCFKYPRVLAKKFSKMPVVFSLYMRRNINANSSNFRMLIERTDMVITSSFGLACALRNSGIRARRLETIYPPVDTDLYTPFNRELSREDLGLKASAKFLLYIGNLGENRFPERIVLNLLSKMRQQDPTIKLLVFSSATNENRRRREEILSSAREIGVRESVNISVKDLTHAEKIRAYSASDVFLFPSNESSKVVEPPLTVLEAMSCGLPVISSNVASVGEVIKDGVNGLVVSFNAEHVPFLSEQISSLLSNDRYSAQMPARARETIVQKMSLKKSCSEFIKACETVV